MRRAGRYLGSGIDDPAASSGVLEVAAAVPAAEVSNVGEAHGDGYQLHVASGGEFTRSESNRIRDIILEKQSFLISKWHEYFNRRQS
jgi:hypothetical protein